MTRIETRGGGGNDRERPRGIDIERDLEEQGKKG